jgi:amidohydrolase
MRATVLKRLDEIVQNVAAANNVIADVTFMNSYPVTYNDPELYEKMLPTLKRVCGADNETYREAIS